MVYSKAIVKIVLVVLGRDLFKFCAFAANFWIKKAVSRDVNRLKRTKLPDS